MWIKYSYSWRQSIYIIFSTYNKTKQILSRGYGDFIDKSIYPFIRMPAGHPEALTDAWANLYISFAIGVDAHINNKNLKKAPYYPSIYEGVSGVAFVEAAIKSNKKKKWVKL